MLLIIALVVVYWGFLRPFFHTTLIYRHLRKALRQHYDDALRGPLAEAVGRLDAAGDIDEKRAAIGEIGKLSGLRESIWALPAIPLRTIATGAFSISTFYPLITITLTFVPGDAAISGAFGQVLSFLKVLIS